MEIDCIWAWREIQNIELLNHRAHAMQTLHIKLIKNKLTKEQMGHLMQTTGVSGHTLLVNLVGWVDLWEKEVCNTEGTDRQRDIPRHWFPWLTNGQFWWAGGQKLNTQFDLMQNKFTCALYGCDFFWKLITEAEP